MVELDSGQALRSRVFLATDLWRFSCSNLEWLNLPLLVGVAALLWQLDVVSQYGFSFHPDDD